MNKQIKWTVCALIGLSFGACDKIQMPLEDGVANLCDPTVIVPRKVLLEDLTGHRCNNCPEAAIIAEDIVSLYGDKVIVTGVHVTSTFADPLLTSSQWISNAVPDSSFMTDFQTLPGDAILGAYTPSGLPAGLVSRRTFNSSIVQGRNNWASAVQAIVCQEAEFELNFASVSYNTTTRNLNVTVSSEVRAVLSGQYELTILLTEDHIFDWQLDAMASPPYVQNYEHRHVLRDKIDAGGNASINGALLFNSGAVTGDVFSTSVSNYTLNPDWVAENCYLVAFVTSPSGEVMQVEETVIIP